MKKIIVMLAFCLLALSLFAQGKKEVHTIQKNGLSHGDSNAEFIEMVLVEAGSFNMGLNNSKNDENPVHQVVLTNDFYMGKYEITQAQYYKVMNIKPSYNAPTTDWEKLPVEQVSWYDAVEFCNRLSEMERLDPYYHIDGTTVTIADKNGEGYRLPTEAEWEYAARGGKEGDHSLEYAGSNNIELVAWHSDNSDNKTKEVGIKQANSLGIYDMSGNVCEWCWDWYGAYSSSSQTNPTGATEGANRLCRGGGYYIIKAGIWRIALRGRDNPSDTPNNLGFRVARFVAS